MHAHLWISDKPPLVMRSKICARGFSQTASCPVFGRWITYLGTLVADLRIMCGVTMASGPDVSGCLSHRLRQEERLCGRIGEDGDCGIVQMPYGNMM